ncbi:hypothetical protein [Mesorhizobium sp. M0678]|uniref:maleate cis-trans isomerase family protein n=1 Tax=Mesorhizobium sp. M0678 TaxID=2956985 RepID=UPI00333C0686
MTDTTMLFDGATAPLGQTVRIGLILLSTDEICADAFTSILPRDDVLVFQTRAAYDEKGAGDDLAAPMTDIVNTLPPPGRFDILAFGCTSATVAMGIDGLVRQLSEARPGLRYTSPAIGAVEALRHLEAQRVALLTPYSLAFHRKMIVFFEENGFEIMADGAFPKQTDSEVAELTPEAIFEAARALVDRKQPDALFISCGATPVTPLIEELEQELGIAVIGSVQAMAWHALRLAGYSRSISGYGRLMRIAR